MSIPKSDGQQLTSAAPHLYNGYFLDAAARLASNQLRHTGWEYTQGDDGSKWNILPLSSCFLGDGVTLATQHGTWGTLPAHWTQVVNSKMLAAKVDAIVDPATGRVRPDLVPATAVTPDKLTPELREQVENPIVSLLYGPGLTVEVVAVDGQQVARLRVDDAYINALIESHSGGTTPAPPTIHADDTANTLYWDVPAGETLELRFQAGALSTYDGHHLSITDIDQAPQAYECRVAARGVNGPSQFSPSPAFTKAPVSPPSSGEQNLLANTNNFNQPANNGWGCSDGNNQAGVGFDGTPGTGVDQTFYQKGSDISSPGVNTGQDMVWVKQSIIIKPFRVSNPSDSPVKLLRGHDIEGYSTIDFDLVNKVVLNATGTASGTITDVSNLGAGYAGALLVTHTYKTTYFVNRLAFSKEDAGVGYASFFKPSLAIVNQPAA